MCAAAAFVRQSRLPLPYVGDASSLFVALAGAWNAQSFCVVCRLPGLSGDGLPESPPEGVAADYSCKRVHTPKAGERIGFWARLAPGNNLLRRPEGASRRRQNEGRMDALVLSFFQNGTRPLSLSPPPAAAGKSEDRQDDVRPRILPPPTSLAAGAGAGAGRR